MRLYPPQIEPNLYEEGFGDTDQLGRRASGERLSELLERIEDPVVIALDGPWGSGKSYFLKRWVGAHTAENKGVGTTVYFDAFANDYLDDPLIGLTSTIGERLPSETDKSKWDSAKRVALKFARPSARIGAAMITSGLSEIAGPLLEKAIATSGQEIDKAADAFWRQEDGRKAAMKKFRDILSQLTHAPSESNESYDRPLIIVIDELDRCRPDYALSVLEVIKHFFSVPRVHFVLGVNLNALANIVQVRYGAGINSIEYLNRFISISMNLPEDIPGHQNIKSQVKYFEISADSMGIEHNLAIVCKRQIEIVADAVGMSLRDVEKILSRLALLPKRKELGRYYPAWQEIVVSLVLMQVLRPDMFRMAISGRIEISQIDEFYGRSEFASEVEDIDANKYHVETIHEMWKYVINKGIVEDGSENHISKSFDGWGGRRVGNFIKNIKRDFFSTFEVVSPE
ncbi:KAP-like P-loop domain-containing protein [Ancylobacter aquaticus]|uniref:KAP-like P-loop domain-containing protein n=1 Tax=Ancylobacter aquaticus TaxID=100 RepID=A0A4R1HZY4_ANCAQ|nr:P-loop NTPase fold protein [Ancylobacter aquaticus]TCK27998.1 KAP-like P-loop domain-containing protein [Ancylobacter aquaticus]